MRARPFVAVLIVALLTAAGCRLADNTPAATQGPIKTGIGIEGLTIKVAELTPLTGSVALIGKPLTRGHEVYFQYVNDVLGGVGKNLPAAQRYKVELAYSLTTVAPVTCPRNDARLLGIRDRSVVLRVSAVGHDPRSRPILAFQATPHTDHARLRFVVRY